MKKLTLIALFLFCAIYSQSQTYYTMFRGDGDSGSPEFICNSAMSLGFTGIQFSTANRIQGVVSGNGRLVMFAPNKNFSPNDMSTINNRVSKIADLSIASTGSIGGLGFKLRKFDTDEMTYTDLRFGRNNDPILISEQLRWLRLSSPAGVAIWGNGKGDTDDNPNLLVNDREVRINYPLKIEENSISIEKNNMSIYAGADDANTSGWIGTKTNTGMYLGTNNHASIYLDNNRGVYVGLGAPDASTIRQELKTKYSLFVGKGVLSEDYGISPKSTWSDYVFGKEYNLRSLQDLSAYIKVNRHLPNVPSAETVAEKGYSQHEMNKVLLEKVEELTLYVIQQQETINELKQKLYNK
jgi:hypothetical protein